VDYARVFSYDEEGRLVKIERDYGDGNLQTAYEYGYTGDGVRVWKRDTLSQQEYRYLCRIGCGGVPMRVYNRVIGGTSWASVEDYLETPTVTGYTKAEGTFGHYVWTSGHWLRDWVANEGWAYYQDWFGVEIGSVYYPAALPKPAPEYLDGDGEILVGSCGDGYVPQYALLLQAAQKDQKPGQKPAPPKKDPFQECLDACAELSKRLVEKCNSQYVECLKGLITRHCLSLYMACLVQTGAAGLGCIASCHENFGKPFPAPIIEDPKKWEDQVKRGVGGYDKCDDEFRKELPKLPKPGLPKMEVK